MKGSAKVFKSYNRQYIVNQDISLVWDEIRSFAETSSISKTSEGLWEFTFSYCKSHYFKSVLATITGRASSNGDDSTKVNIKSDTSIGTRISLIGIIVMILITNIVSGTGMNIFLKVLLLITFFFVIEFLHTHETKMNISELETKLKIRGNS